MWTTINNIELEPTYMRVVYTQHNINIYSVRFCVNFRNVYVHDIHLDYILLTV